LPLKDDTLSKLDVFHLRGLRRKLGLKTTYIDRTNTNKRILEIAEQEANKDRKEGDRKRIRLMSEIVKERCIKELGEVLRLGKDDPRRKVTFLNDSAKPNLPPINRVGQPKAQWALVTMKRLWSQMAMNERSRETLGETFNYKNEKHLEIMLEAAQLEEFWQPLP
jgi:hypothetical protein